MSVAEDLPPPPPQAVRFCRAPDGTRIAYAVHGSGPPLVVDACWMSHLQFDWQSPVWRHFLDDLGKIATVIRYDERGHGLSDWDADDFSAEARLSDLEAVVEDAGFAQFTLMAMSQGGPISIMYAVRHPERVARLIFYSSYAAAGRAATPEDLEVADAYDQLTKVGWDRPTPEFRRVFTFNMIPGATEEQMRWLDELQRMSTSAEVSLRARRERRKADAERERATSAGSDAISTLSEREVGVLRLVADGDDNDHIATELFISVRTVERHVQNIYTKLGVSGRSARTAAAAALLNARR